MSALRGHAALLVALLLASCDGAVRLGSYARPDASADGDAAAGADGSGAAASPGIGGGGAEVPPPLYPLTIGFEEDETPAALEVGWLRTLNTGLTAVVEEGPRSGSRALRAELLALGDQALFLLDVPARVRAGAYYFLPEDVDTSYWVLMKLRSGQDGADSGLDVFDVDVNAEGAGTYRFVLWEHGVGEILAADRTFTSKEWVRLEVELVADASAGSLRVFQDGALVMDTGARETLPADAPVTFAVGSVADWIDPLPAAVLVDDVSVAELP